MASGLLTSLRKYYPRDNSDPLENFITEAFAWMLRKHPNFGHFFLDRVISSLGVLSLSESSLLEWHTQLHFDGVYPDLVCEVEGRAFIFEHKTWSPLHDKQLTNYRRHAETKYGSENYRLILITAETKQHEQNPDLPLCWRNVHAWIKEWQAHTKYEPDFLFNDFCELLENEGLGPPAPISHDAILSFIPARNFIANVEALIARAATHSWDSLFPDGVFKLNIQKNNWGRLGLDFMGFGKDWTPGIFAGFYHSTHDHFLPLLNPGIPDFSVIISFNINLYPRYDSEPLYQAMVSHLEAAVKISAPEFDFVNHLATPLPHNRWHPIHIRMSMLELMRGTHTADEQKQRFIDKTSSILQLIYNCPPFWDLHKALRLKIANSATQKASVIADIS